MADSRKDEYHPDGTSSVEKGAIHNYVVDRTDDRYHFDPADLDRVQRKLKQRHVQMIAVSSSFYTFSQGGRNAAPMPCFVNSSIGKSCAQLW